MEEKLKVLLVDDEKLLIESLEIILTMKADIQIAGKANDGNEALLILSSNSVDIALVDLNMKGMGGIELIKNIKEKYPSVKILVLTTFYDDKYIADAISNGANGYILKDAGSDAIVNAIKNIMSGQSVLDSKVLSKLSKIIVSPPEKNNLNSVDINLSELTKRELEICSMIAQGYTNPQISKFLFISEGTVKNYISSIYDKLDIHDRAKLAIYLKNLKL